LGDNPNLRFVAADVYRLPFVEGAFDGATMIRTLHHMADAPAALAQVRRVLSENATFILEYANKRNLKSMLRYLLGKQKWSPYTAEPVEYLELNFDFHPTAIRTWMKDAGFHIEKTITVSHYRIGFLKRAIPTGLLAGLDSLAGLTGDLWQLSPSVFLRTTALRGTSVKTEAAGGFACPVCKTPLEDTPPLIRCPKCEHTYPVKDGIYDFRLDIKSS
jgi:SAM-dependent methyltransferase